MQKERELVLNKYKQEHKQEKNEIFLKIKESFKSLDIPEHKKLVIGDCQTLRDLCSAVSCQETHNYDATGSQDRKFMQLIPE
ncbi:hypothetical protein [Piscirickettsia salmonis]|uniref:hypothetical protein n=1 Tax=Piscirickettsia salmonis TaxID=1238 RepID=UPI000332C18A|nr:hypothetical protein [Piscirickettsia salmonis]APS58875.1 hypothetical protein AVI52_16640 [Piscirickettsia salmonis]ERL60630.1 hypothetical protein K661_03051 [Piscirickettsia salmonis LF-89 = ATCC VR-1361]PEQ15159.1 hypothetical protein X973_14270 [Piscirickettsia salmonis]QNR82525.1 hypothetical protein ICC15_18885 [Piscirickettsia salmonis]QNR82534.1 hypothetical protein ICC15_18940 [Piscirickettsia salmonis]